MTGFWIGITVTVLIVIGASVGIAIADGRTHPGAETLIRNADLALYSAKENGRGIWKSYSEDMHKVAHDRRALEGELRAALQAGGMSIAYQPVVNGATETISRTSRRGHSAFWAKAGAASAEEPAMRTWRRVMVDIRPYLPMLGVPGGVRLATH